MKALFTTIASVAALVAVSGLLSGSVRSRVSQQFADFTQWTAADREANPVGFADYARERLQQDLTVMQQTRRELSVEVGSLAEKLREKQALHDQAQQLADEFRSEYQTASSDGSFPIELRGAAYTEAQVKSQVSMLLAEADGFATSLADLQWVQQQAESQVEELAVRISSTETQLAMLSTERELLRARLVTGDGEELMAQMDELMAGNSRLIAGNPVRPVSELAEVPVDRPNVASRESVEEFLNAPSQIAPVTFNEEATEPCQPEKSRARKGKAKERRVAKPIFQQS